MARDEERARRAKEAPVIGSLPDAPGIVAAMRLAPNLALHLRGLADTLLVEDFPGATLSRAERELIATAVSAANACFYCMDSHGAFAAELLQRDNVTGIDALVDGVKNGASPVAPKLAALLELARVAGRNARDVTRDHVSQALAAGATDGDTQLAILIAAAFSMYNRMVDGLRAQTPTSTDAYRARAREIASHGYSDPRVQSLPR
jgi:uncharacterized peroxidase-related enzyme